jgi:hypothetical protein
MTNALIRGYTNFGFEAWTIPCLYIAGKYMRIFGIKADEESGSNTAFNSNFEDDLNGDSSENAKLEDAARVLNRIFQICLSDRYVINRMLLPQSTKSCAGHHLKTLENGESTTLSTSCSRHTLNSTLSVFRKTLFVHWLPQEGTCLSFRHFQSHTKSPSSTMLV